MCDKEVYEKFMMWMGMVVYKSIVIDGNTVLIYRDTNNFSDVFQCVGYDEFYSGAVFNSNGDLTKGYLDSHVAHSSCNYEEIREMLNNQNNKLWK